MSKDDFQKVLDSMLRQGQPAPQSNSGGVTSILSKLLSATKGATAKPLASVRALLPAAQKQTVDSSGSSSGSAARDSSVAPAAASADTQSSTTLSSAGGTLDAGSFANQFQKFTSGTAGKTIAGATPAQAQRILGKTAPAPKSTGSSITNILSKIPGLSFAISPIISGIIGLFGGNHSSAPALTPFVLPSSVQLEAAIGPGDSLLPTSQGANGLPKLNGVAGTAQKNASVSQQTTAQQNASQQINSTPPALDSRFFLDHSDQIALAVKDAMLHSSSLNDVITDL